MRELAGRTAVVTGAASGIGCSLARRFADEQMRVVLADVEADALEATASELAATAPGRIVAVTTDVSDANAVDALAERACTRSSAPCTCCATTPASSRVA